MQIKLFVPLVFYLCLSIILNAQDVPSYPNIQDNLAPQNAQSFTNYKAKPSAYGQYGSRCYYTYLGELSNCSNALLGIGAYYENFNGPTSSVDGIGGYISGIAKIYTKWFYFGTEAMLGYAKNTLNNKTLIIPNNNNKKQDIGYDIAASIHLGVDLSYLNGTPVLLYANFTGDLHFFTKNRYAQGFNNINVYLGFGAFSEIMLTQRFGLNFQVGLAYAFGRRYLGYGIDTKKLNFDGSYKLEAAISMVWRDYKVLPPHRNHRMPTFYAKLKGIYYDFCPMDLTYKGEQQYFNDSSIHLSKTKNFTLMFEVGLDL
ncbi:hypothetical protein LS73_009395 [Helicobacter muridarum]|uniref:Outer membrane protein n=1 Tax=Helicobacter muridarum TaxID=216 RepID=A0A099TV01_9HELI|nr:hypothetical protein [Helicobacter muridarum]TLD98113.1 hypothetical protein LS73_009395 [Helicobacter muridarum]STQ86396.1 Uncharacterised protein [Helicobacter muridarum]